MNVKLSEQQILMIYKKVGNELLDRLNNGVKYLAEMKNLSNDDKCKILQAFGF